MFSYNRATLDELHPSFFSEKWLSVLARSTFLVETTFLRIITGCVCVNCEGLGIKFKSYASSCLIFNAYLPRVACSYHKEMTIATKEPLSFTCRTQELNLLNFKLSQDFFAEKMCF